MQSLEFTGVEPQYWITIWNVCIKFDLVLVHIAILRFLCYTYMGYHSWMLNKFMEIRHLNLYNKLSLNVHCACAGSAENHRNKLNFMENKFHQISCR